MVCIQPTQLLYSVAFGAPLPAGTERCWLCGSLVTSEGAQLTSKFIKPTFTDIDYAQAPESNFVCAACVWCISNKNVELQRHIGKEKPQRLRNYSVLVKDGTWHAMSKARKTQIAQMLIEPPFPQLAIIAESGQKHLIFKARTNPDGCNSGYVQFEENRFFVHQDKLRADLLLVELMHTVFSKKEIRTGNYNHFRIREFGAHAWSQCEEIIRELRGSARFALSLFLAQRRDDAKERFKAGCGHAVACGLGRDTGGVQNGVCEKHLGAVSGSSGSSGIHKQSGEIHQLTLL